MRSSYAVILVLVVVTLAIVPDTEATSMTQYFEYINSDFYGDLGIPFTATKSEIKKAYRKLSLQYHPDKSNHPDAESMFHKISRAYEVLKDDATRKGYDDLMASLPSAMHPRNKNKRVPVWIVLLGLTIGITALEWWAKGRRYQKRLQDPKYLHLLAQANEKGLAIENPVLPPTVFGLFIFQFPFYPFYILRFVLVQSWFALQALKDLPTWWEQHKAKLEHERKLSEVAARMAAERAAQEPDEVSYESKKPVRTATTAMKKEDEKHKKKLKDYRSALMRRIQRNWDESLDPPIQDDAKAISSLLGYKKLNDLAIALATSKDKQQVGKKVDETVKDFVVSLIQASEEAANRGSDEDDSGDSNITDTGLTTDAESTTLMESGAPSDAEE